jgi:hypothetical protein
VVSPLLPRVGGRTLKVRRRILLVGGRGSRVEGVLLFDGVLTPSLLYPLQCAVSALSFSPAGDSIASYCAEERSLRIWSSSGSGFLGALLGYASKCLQSLDLPKLLVVPGANDVLFNVRLQWLSPAVLRLIREDRSVVNVAVQT